MTSSAAPRCFLASSPSTASQLHGTATTTISKSNERRLNWNRQRTIRLSKNQKDARSSIPATRITAIRTDQTLCRLKANHSKMLGQKQKPLDRQHQDHEAIRREAVPAGFLDGDIGHDDIIAEPVPQWQVRYQAKWAKALLASAMRWTFSRFV